MKKTLAGTGIIVLVLAGCSSKTASPLGAGAETTYPPSSPTSSYDPEGGLAPSTTDEYTPPDPSTEADATAHFGSEGYKWEDGLEIAVGQPVVFTPSEYAAGTGKGTSVKFKITITNKTGKAYDASMLTTSAQSNTEEAEEIFDTENGLGGSPSTQVLAGRTVTFSVGYTVANAKDVVLEVKPGFDYKPAMFQS